MHAILNPTYDIRSLPIEVTGYNKRCYWVYAQGLKKLNFIKLHGEQVDKARESKILGFRMDSKCEINGLDNEMCHTCFKMHRYIPRGINLVYELLCISS